jgi:hypothetical protein
MNQMTTFGGGNFPRSFTMGGQTYPTWQMGAQGAELSPIARQLGVQVLPAGTTSRQEFRYLLEEAKRSGRPYVEAPEVYTRGGRELDRYGRQKDPTGLYNQQGRRFSGSFLGSGSSSGIGISGKNTTQRGWSNYTGDNPINMYKGGAFYEDSPSWRRGGTGIPEEKPKKGDKDKPQEVKNTEEDQFRDSPFGRDYIRGLTGFGGVPIFPY